MQGLSDVEIAERAAALKAKVTARLAGVEPVDS